MAHLLAVLLPLAVVLGFGVWLLRRSGADAWLGRTLPGDVWVGLAWALLLLYLASVVMVASFPVAVDAVEVTVASTSALLLRGLPLYTGLADPARYSLLYGPMCTLPLTAGLALLGGGLGALKATAVVFNVALLGVLWLVFRRVVSAPAALVATGATAAALMMKTMAVFLIRGDAPLALAVALALLATSLRRRWAALGVFALGAAWAVDIKFTAAFYLLLPLYLLARRQGWKVAAGALALGAGLALLPFSLPQVSLGNYLLWLHEAAHHPLGLRLFAMNVAEDLLLLAPVVLLLLAWFGAAPAEARQFLREHRVPAALLLLGLAGTTVVGSKIGAGRSHLDPDAALLFYAAAQVWRRMRIAMFTPGLRAGFAIYALFLVVPAVSQAWDLWGICVRRHAWAVAVNKDLTAVLARYGGRRIEMAYDFSGGPLPVDDLTSFKTRLVLAGQPMTVDAGALFDMGLSGLPVPAATVAYIRACGTPVWLVPRGTAPFGIYNTYFYDVPGRFPDPLLFGAEFREAFFSRYRLVGSSRFFDVWGCEGE